jgi:5-methyltetrahydrofolate--homocysteine methyltransferase
MADLLYRPGWTEARARLTKWWQGEDIGRPAMQITVRRATPWEDIAALPEPPGWVTHYSYKSLDHRVNMARRACLYTDYVAEACPSAAPGDLGPGCVSLYLGCEGTEMPGTMWFEPCIHEPETARIEIDRENFYWQFSLAAHQATLPYSHGRFMQQFPDLIEGLDTLAALRETQVLLVDLIERPEWVHRCLRQITDKYFCYYDSLYELIRDEVGGSYFWAWAPGRMVKLQCDFSAMISPGMFGEFMGPVLTEMTERTAHNMYHLDGPEALRHLPVLLGIPRLNMIQWTPGAGQPFTDDPVWFPMYRQVLDAGKSLFVFASDRDRLLLLKREFGSGLKQMMVNMSAPTVAEAEALIRDAED